MCHVKTKHLCKISHYCEFVFEKNHLKKTILNQVHHIFSFGCSKYPNYKRHFFQSILKTSYHLMLHPSSDVHH
jgi:hypothetical protein